MSKSRFRGKQDVLGLEDNYLKYLLNIEVETGTGFVLLRNPQTEHSGPHILEVGSVTL